MLRILKTVIIYLAIYSVGFLSGMNYHGEDKATALQEDLINKGNAARDRVKSIVNRASEKLAE